MRVSARLAACPLALTLSLCLVAGSTAADSTGRPVAITYGTVPLDTANPDSTLTAPEGSSHFAWRGGLELRSSDERFGGISGLLVSADGTSLTAVTDTGYWLTAHLSYSDGALSGVSDMWMAPILDEQGESVAGSKRLGDAEALTRLEDGRLAVSFERKHRVWAYDIEAQGFAATARPVEVSPALAEVENNKGLEALVSLPGNRLIAITEATMRAGNEILGWHITSDGSTEVGLVRLPPFDLTDMALLPDGDALTLERRYSPIGGVGAQIRRLPATALTADALRQTPLDGPVLYRSSASQSVDNMEGLAVREDADGRVFAYLVSDDNFNPIQRTLLFMFELTSDD